MVDDGPGGRRGSGEDERRQHRESARDAVRHSLSVKLPQDMPFYPGTWLVGYAILALCWIYVDVWVAIGAFFGFMALEAVLVEGWAAARSRG